MRKNLFGRMRLTVKSRYLVQGLNLDFFINALKKRGVTLYDVKKFGNKRLYLSVNFNERRKFFAIAKEMCYNVTKVGEKGRGKALLTAYRSFGLVLGCAIIAIISIFPGARSGTTPFSSGTMGVNFCGVFCAKTSSAR